MGEASGTDETLDAPGETRASPTQQHPGELARGSVVGRYVVLAKLGAGGMGVVYSAYDPELDRKLAIKVLRPDLGGTGGDGAARLMREAQALGKLSHPNVVAVHDVGARDEEVWIAMEFVEGRTLGDWIKEGTRSWRDVLSVMRPVAQGLAAAHQAGLVHRDVKPDNVMLGDDGRVRVMDFGLVRGTRTDTAEPNGDDELRAGDGAESRAHPRRRALEAVVTRAGATPGTPAYMAPEQLAGTPTDARTDQFSYCVMSWEALFGQRPFGGESFLELATNVLEGNRRSPPAGAKVPRWLRAVVHRGLAVDPAERWPSLEALLEALDRGLVWGRLSKALAGLAVLGLAGAGVAGARTIEERRKIAACEEGAAAIDAVWNDDERSAVRSGLLATGSRQAAVTADKVMPWLDAQATAWRTARAEACLAAEVHGRWDADLFDRASWCLDERRMELGALVTELKDAEAGTVIEAVTAAAGLSRVEPCGDPSFLQRLPAPPLDDRDTVQAIRAELSKVAALEATGMYAEGLDLGRQSLGRAKALGWPPLLAAAELRVGVLLEKSGAFEEAEAMQESAFFDASKAGALEEALSAAQRLVYSVGYRRARHRDGERWARHAEVLRQALPDPAALREATSLDNLASVRESAGAYEEAGRLQERALAIRERALGPEHPDVASSLNNLANVRRATGAYEEAGRLHERALAIREKALGPEHPEVATSLHNLATVQEASGEYEEARRLYERELDILKKALGPEHPDLAQSLNNLANVRYGMGAYEEARLLYESSLGILEKALGPEDAGVAAILNNLAVVRETMGAYEDAGKLHERALSILEKELGTEHPHVAMCLSNVGNVRYRTGAYEEAGKLHERALAIREKALGPEHPDVAASLDNLAAVREAMGAYEEARELYRNAVGISEKALGPEHPAVARALLGLARLATAQGRPGDGLAPAERAVKIREAGEVPAAELAEARFVLARALIGAGKSQARALALATQAREAYREGGDEHDDALAEVEAFLRERGAGE